MLKYATTLTKRDETRQEGIKLFLSGMAWIKELKQTLNESDLPFNMLLFMLMESAQLDKGTLQVDLSAIEQMVTNETGNQKFTHNQVKKQTLYLIHQASNFAGADVDGFIN